MKFKNQVFQGAIVLSMSVFLAGCKDDAPDLDQGAVDRGQALAEDNCTSCHRLTDKDILVGPPLRNVIGRQIGSFEGFEYSRDMAVSEDTWTQKNVAAFILAPYDIFPNTKMAVAELTEAEAKDISVFIQSLD